MIDSLGEDFRFNHVTQFYCALDSGGVASASITGIVLADLLNVMNSQEMRRRVCCPLHQHEQSKVTGAFFD
jgi:hypothetical protein